jgi:hypothetical protein
MRVPRVGCRTPALNGPIEIYLEPRRLASRYLMTNPHALFLLLTRTRHVNKPIWNSGQQ